MTIGRTYLRRMSGSRRKKQGKVNSIWLWLIDIRSLKDLFKCNWQDVVFTVECKWWWWTLIGGEIVEIKKYASLNTLNRKSCHLYKRLWHMNTKQFIICKFDKIYLINSKVEIFKYLQV